KSRASGTKAQAAASQRSKKTKSLLQNTSRRIRLGKNFDYEQELGRLQIELVKLHEWIRHAGLKVAILFEGRDAAGKGSAIKRITQTLNPRICRVVALGTPTE